MPGIFKIKTNRTFKIEHTIIEIRNQLNRLSNKLDTVAGWISKPETYMNETFRM